MTRARLGGVDLLAAQPVGWAFVAGVRPHIRPFEMATADAERIAATGGTNLTLEIEPEGWPKLVVKRLVFVALTAGSRPDTRQVIIADQRYLWARRTVHRDYNARIRSGDTRLLGEGSLRVENQGVVSDATYASWSLDPNGRRWTPDAMIRDVLKAVGAEGARLPAALSRRIEIEDLTLSSTGAAAVERALAYVGGYSIRLDADGLPTVFDTRDRSEIRAIADAGPPLRVGGAFHAVSDRSWSRPSLVRVLFDRETELRLDFVEGETSWTTTRNAVEAPRRLENVIPVPDVSIVVAGRTVSRGTWVNIDDYLAALAGLEAGTAGAGLGPLTQARIRQAWLFKWDYFVSGLYGVDQAGNPNLEWRRRIAAIRRHWRQSFRPLKTWRDKLRSVKAYRVAVLDPETGARAPSEAYMDYVARPSRASLHKDIARNPDLGRQVAGYAALLKDGEVAPAEVRVVDDEAMIFSVALRPDPWGEVESLAPGNVDKLPKRKVTGSLKDAAGLAYGWWADLALVSTFRIALVFTAIQAAPNNEGRMHALEVKPDRAQAVLGQTIGACKGEPWTVYIGGGVETARTAWLDDLATVIEGAFYRGDKMPDSLVVNMSALAPRAEAEAARIYGAMLDREEGSIVVPFAPDVTPTGSIGTVEHALAPNGRAMTSITVLPELEPLDAMSLIPSSAQRVIRRMVQP